MSGRRIASPSPISDAASNQRTSPAERWEALFGCPAPARLPSLVASAVAWREQVDVHGDIDRKIAIDLKLIANEVRASRAKRRGLPVDNEADGLRAPRTKPAIAEATLRASRTKPAGPLPPVASQLSVGTKLVKAYAGETHVVEVTASGMLYKGETFSSLSAVAKVITGTHWNGLLFFGLRRRKPYDRKAAEQRKLANG